MNFDKILNQWLWSKDKPWGLFTRLMAEGAKEIPEVKQPDGFREMKEDEVCKSCHEVENNTNCDYHGQWHVCKKCGYGIAGKFKVEDMCESCVKSA